MEKITWKVDGMTCSNCALSIHKLLEKKGLNDVKVNPIDGVVHFEWQEAQTLESIKKDIAGLGYKVINESQSNTTSISISPNPTNNFAKITSSVNIDEIEISNLVGEIIFCTRKWKQNFIFNFF
jgi:copper chaperone CopZ